MAVAPQLNPEALLGMMGPLASALVTWIVVARTALGATRVVDRPLGEQLPRIC